MDRTPKTRQRLDSFERALARLQEAIDDAENELEIDGTIQRFEFTFELFWKLLQAVLGHEGVMCRSPRACLKDAFRLALIDDEGIAIRMLEDRNETVHLYDEDASRAVYDRIRREYVHFFREAYGRIQQRIAE